jgi:hypothetical protein
MMTPFAIGVMAGLMFLQASIAAPRQGFTECLKKASLQAAAQKVAPDQYSAYASAQCSSQASSFKGALAAFDVKNGVKRAQATSDAQAQIDDYVAMSLEKYEAKASANAEPAPAPAPAPVVQAAASTPKQD